MIFCKNFLQIFCLFCKNVFTKKMSKVPSAGRAPVIFDRNYGSLFRTRIRPSLWMIHRRNTDPKLVRNHLRFHPLRCQLTDGRIIDNLFAPSSLTICNLLLVMLLRFINRPTNHPFKNCIQHGVFKFWFNPFTSVIQNSPCHFLLTFFIEFLNSIPPRFIKYNIHKPYSLSA